MDVESLQELGTNTIRSFVKYIVFIFILDFAQYCRSLEKPDGTIKTKDTDMK